MSAPLDIPASQRKLARRPAWQLTMVTVAVLLAHWGALHALPQALVFPPQSATASAPMVFNTRVVPETPPKATPPTPSPQITEPRRRESEPPEIAPIPPEKRVQSTPDLTAKPEETANTQDAQEMQLAAANTSGTDHSGTGGGKTTDTVGMANYAVPGSVRLKYDVKGEKGGIPIFANGELLWLQDGTNYEARMEISILMFSRVQTSKGQLGNHGLEPLRFGDKVRSEVAAHFDRSKGKVTFSANTPDVTLQPGAQDQLSIFMHVASLIGGDPRRFTPGTEMSFQAIGPRSSETWSFTVGNLETLTLPGGTVKAIKLSRPPANEYSPRADVWLAPEMAYMPVRIRLTEANGDVADQQWSATQKP